jgi:hypothetical protein
MLSAMNRMRISPRPTRLVLQQHRRWPPSLAFLANSQAVVDWLLDGSRLVLQQLGLIG